MRAQNSMTPVRAEKITALLENSLKQRVVQMVLRQRNEDTTDVIIQCAQANRIDRQIRKLADEGFEEGPSPSKDIILHEGQELQICFRGNIQNDCENNLRTCFNSHIKSQFSFKVTEIDRFAQKTIDCFRGFAQVYTPGMVLKKIPKDAQKNQTVQEEMVEGNVLLCEMLISLPKV